MPSIEVDRPMGDSFLPYHPAHHNNQSQSCLQDNAPPFSPSSVYSQASRTSRSYGSLSFLPSTSYRSESADQPFASSRRITERPPVYISPFRSVRQMREPFQLKLPSSPSFENHNSSASSKEQPRTLQSPIGLRPLRSCRSDQHLVGGALESFGLLPSPSLSDSRIQSKPDSSPPKREIQRDERQSATIMCSCTPPDRLCELCVVSSYEGQMTAGSMEPPKDTDMTTEPANVVDEERQEVDEKPEEPVTNVMESIPPGNPVPNPTSTPLTQFTEFKSSPGSSGKSKKRTRTGTVSSSASWTPGDLSYCERWLQGVPLDTPERKDEKAREANRRKCQIVQQDKHSRKPVNLRIDTDVANHSVMFAVASKTKPKLVDISRRSSSVTSFSVQIHPPPSWRRPSTPEQCSNEISAFSPDTPQELPDSGYATQQSNHSSEGSQDFCEEDYADCALGLRSPAEPPFTGDIAFRSFMFGGKPHDSKHRPVPSSQKPASSSPEVGKRPHLRTPPPLSPKTVDQETLEKWWDYEWTLDQLELSVKDFPKSMLRLTSPVIILLRQNHEEALLRPFRKIFPGVTESLLDYLCAALIARNYLVSMASTHHPRDSSSLTFAQPSTNLSRLDSVPEKARATLGLTLPSASRFQIAERLMGSRSLELRKGLDRIVDKLIFTICGRSDDTLKAAVVVLTQVLESKT
ncbi:hypothetical protein VTN77DRAFT_7841 [Rasamsonia byssochlamydoides]|uniref:uncharacterized protein n=1 Tax=Rasamsonia byssochlamydoides TaxID=89139 RepID=UPI00374336B4